MAKPNKEPATPSPATDEFAGIGGSYLIDADGKKSLVERTQPADETNTTAPE